MEEKNNIPPEYSAQPAKPEQFVQYGGHPNQYVGQPAQYVAQPGTNNPAFVQGQAPAVIYLQPGQQVVNGQVVGQQQFAAINTPATCDKSKMPSVACPIFACICCWPLGIGALIFYLRAQGSQGNCFYNSQIAKTLSLQSDRD